ncbi:MAG: hypothetical protein DME59_21050 [Verrucomicrobia bacterium]|nr:MAG: hypothetical protein DME59_21050 [Verrucomicrobiota bacterium]
MPVKRCPKLAKRRPGLETDDRFTAAPWLLVCGKGIPCDDEHVCAVAGYTAMSPDPTAYCVGGPSHHVGGIVDLHSYNPAMVVVAIAHIPGVRHIHNPIHKSQRASFFLHKGIESYAVVMGGGIHIHRPAGMGHTSVYVQRKNKMLNRISIDHGIEEE